MKLACRRVCLILPASLSHAYSALKAEQNGKRKSGTRLRVQYISSCKRRHILQSLRHYLLLTGPSLFSSSRLDRAAGAAPSPELCPRRCSSCLATCNKPTLIWHLRICICINSNSFPNSTCSLPMNILQSMRLCFGERLQNPRSDTLHST